MSRHARSHPPTLLTLSRRALEGECGPVRGQTILVAVSGGRDSMALLHVLARLREPLGFAMCARGIDHGLRPEASSELAAAAALAARLEVPFDTARVRLDKGGNLQARARDARYEALKAGMAAAGATLLATAHHADDRAETVLLRLLRGASSAGLGVLPARAGARIRPFIRAHRAAIDAHVARHEVPFADDPSNEDARFARTRVRHEVLPLLTQLSPGIVEHLCALADDLAPANAAAALASAPSLPRSVRTALAALGSLAGAGNTAARVALRGSRDARFDRVLGRVLVESRDTHTQEGREPAERDESGSGLKGRRRSR